MAADEVRRCMGRMQTVSVIRSNRVKNIYTKNRYQRQYFYDVYSRFGIHFIEMELKISVFYLGTSLKIHNHI